MKQTMYMIQNDLVSDYSGETPKQSNSFISTFKREFKKALGKECTNIKFKVGYFYISGFFTKNGQTYYFSSGDTRDPYLQDIMIRKCKNYEDYSGESNMWHNLLKFSGEKL